MRDAGLWSINLDSSSKVETPEKIDNYGYSFGVLLVALAAAAVSVVYKFYDLLVRWFL